MEFEINYLKSSLFEIEPGEDEETNPGIYGRQFANWLREKFIEKGYDVEEVIPEDWGWCVMCARIPYLLWVGCSSVQDLNNSDINSSLSGKEAVTWTCFATAELPWFKRIFSRTDTQPGLTKLQSELHDILLQEERINIID